jgi:hypothetical protein
VVIDVLVQDFEGGSPSVEDAALWKEELDLSYPVLADVDGSFYATYGWNQDVFVFYIVDRDGVITWREAREEESTLERIRGQVEALLTE